MAITVGVIGATGTMGRMVVEGLLSSSTDFSVTSFTRKASISNRANLRRIEKGVKIVRYDLDDQRENLWVEPAPRGVIGIKDKMIDWLIRLRILKFFKILVVIQHARLLDTIIDVGCWYQVWVRRVPSERSYHAHSIYIDHRIVGDGSVGFTLTDLSDIGKYVAQIVADPRTLNGHVLAYTEVLSMNEILDMMAKASG
ncbi:hypothetical protein BJX63DRAFT_422967 [Aspergillus granulosus]|uniref:NmrA-like domain-containing protein n=1 Tax=Aspergillus granulosus TaxID=176169 RepID=A0ABR4H5B1_9EURO